MSISKIFESVDSGKLQLEAIPDSLVTPKQLAYALQVCGFDLQSLQASVSQIKRTKKKESGKMISEEYEIDISKAVGLLSPIFSKFILEVEVRKVRQDGTIAVIPSARWSYVGGGANGVLADKTAYSKDNGSSWDAS